MFFFGLSTWALVLLLLVIMVGATVAGLAAGKALGARSDTLREPLGVMQGALVGFMGLVLAFGLSLALGRYESRRAHVVDEAKAPSPVARRAPDDGIAVDGRTATSPSSGSTCRDLFRRDRGDLSNGCHKLAVRGSGHSSRPGDARARTGPASGFSGVMDRTTDEPDSDGRGQP